MSESTELRHHAETWRLMATAYEYHVRCEGNSPVAQAAYEAVRNASHASYRALAAAADLLDEEAGIQLPLRVNGGVA